MRGGTSRSVSMSSGTFQVVFLRCRLVVMRWGGQVGGSVEWAGGDGGVGGLLVTLSLDGNESVLSLCGERGLAPPCAGFVRRCSPGKATCRGRQEGRFIAFTSATPHFSVSRRWSHPVNSGARNCISE
jgi:hypothetical protein